MVDERRGHRRSLRHLLVAVRRGDPAGQPVRDMEEWVWAHLPYRVANFIANTHDMLPFTKGEWSADKDGFVR